MYSFMFSFFQPTFGRLIYVVMHRNFPFTLLSSILSHEHATSERYCKVFLILLTTLPEMHLRYF